MGFGACPWLLRAPQGDAVDSDLQVVGGGCPMVNGRQISWPTGLSPWVCSLPSADSISLCTSCHSLHWAQAACVLFQVLPSNGERGQTGRDGVTEMTPEPVTWGGLRALGEAGAGPDHVTLSPARLGQKWESQACPSMQSERGLLQGLGNRHPVETPHSTTSFRLTTP